MSANINIQTKKKPTIWEFSGRKFKLYFENIKDEREWFSLMKTTFPDNSR